MQVSIPIPVNQNFLCLSYFELRGKQKPAMELANKYKIKCELRHEIILKLCGSEAWNLL